ncbi:MAG: fumarylacetoacetate hydrolase family protein [Arenimonas sp.]|nr:fumarylacetoacetate hydrolase family protein [Arenimonas sp.]
MSNYAFKPPAQAAIAILNTELFFPIHRIYCVGRNFAEHAKEMGAEVPKNSPVFFMKPADAVTQSAQIPYPLHTNDLHHELELVVALGPTIPAKITTLNAADAIFGYAIGLDLTRRDLQAIAKEKRLPWDTAKGFDASAPISHLVRATDTNLSAESRIRLLVNGELRQQDQLGQMIFSVPEIVFELSKLFQLQAGDLIFMGTPAGVAALIRGDSFTAELEGIVSFSGTII